VKLVFVEYYLLGEDNGRERLLKHEFEVYDPFKLLEKLALLEGVVAHIQLPEKHHCHSYPPRDAVRLPCQNPSKTGYRREKRDKLKKIFRKSNKKWVSGTRFARKLFSVVSSTIKEDKRHPQ
jgi:hypothetical protein